MPFVIESTDNDFLKSLMMCAYDAIEIINKRDLAELQDMKSYSDKDVDIINYIMTLRDKGLTPEISMSNDSFKILFDEDRGNRLN